jgi:hypothetical protein
MKLEPFGIEIYAAIDGYSRYIVVKDKGPFNHETGNDRMCAACIVINACGVRQVIDPAS